MANELQTKLNAILLDKNTNLLPENLKKDITCLGVTGTLESGGSTDYNVKANLSDTGGQSFYKYITEIKDIDTYNVTNMNNLFRDLSNLTKISRLDTSNAISMDYTFFNCINLINIPELDTKNVTEMASIVRNCTSLTTIPQLNTSNVTTMECMFKDCTSLTTIPQLNTSNVTNMYQMFYNCSSLTTIPLLDTSSVIGIVDMFKNCTSLSDESLNNILAMCINATSYTNTKTLAYIGLTSKQCTRCATLSNYQAFLNAGWTTGY